MMEERNLEDKVLRCKLRLDFLGLSKPAKFFFGGKDSIEVAEEIREKQIMVWENIPIQGLEIEHIEQKEPYTILEDTYSEEIAYAPVEIIISADSCEAILPFIIKPELRKIEVFEPESVNFTTIGLERFFIKINEELQKQIDKLRKQMDA